MKKRLNKARINKLFVVSIPLQHLEFDDFHISFHKLPNPSEVMWNPYIFVTYASCKVAEP